MRINSRTRLGLLLGATIAALVLLAAALPALRLEPGRPFPLEGFGFLSIQPMQGRFGPSPRTEMLPIVLLWGLLILSVVYMIVSPQLRRRVLRITIVYAAWALFVYLLMNALSRNNAEREQETEGPAGGEALPNELSGDATAPPSFVTEPPEWLIILVSLLLIAFAIGIVWLIVRRLPRRRPEHQAQEIAQEAEEAIEQIRAGADLRDVVMRCYLEMSRVLDHQRGVHLHQAMTPREFEGRLAAVGLRDEHIQRLTRLFERVRYGDRTSGQREEREAIDCLNAIVQAYGRAP